MTPPAEFPGPRLLGDFLDRNDIGKEAAAEALRVTRVTLWSWLNGQSAPSKRCREDIALWTKGEVPETSWPPLADRRKRHAAVKPFEPNSNSGTGKDAA